MEEFLFFALAAVLVALTLLIRHNTRVQKERDARAALQTYEHVCSPILVTSNFPEDETVYLRAEAWRQKLRAAGNRYSETLPIVPYPFALGASGATGSLRTWLTYQENCILKSQELLAEWRTRMAKENDPLFVGHILQQKPGQN